MRPINYYIKIPKVVLISLGIILIDYQIHLVVKYIIYTSL